MAASSPGVRTYRLSVTKMSDQDLVRMSTEQTRWFGTPGKEFGLDYVRRPLSEADAVALIERYEDASAALRRQKTEEASDAYVSVYRELLKALTRDA